MPADCCISMVCVSASLHGAARAERLLSRSLSILNVRVSVITESLWFGGMWLTTSDMLSDVVLECLTVFRLSSLQYTTPVLCET